MTPLEDVRAIDHDIEQSKHEVSDGDYNTQWLEASFQFCVPAPVIAPSSRYLSLTFFGQRKSMYFWKLEK